MSKHVLRPFWVILAVVAIVLLVRHLLVPKDFDVHGASFTYSFYRLGNVEEWKNVPLKYRGSETCRECHPENVDSVTVSSHKDIQCENCHGPARNHPDDPESLSIDRDRLLCLRCHTALSYPTSQRAAIIGINPEEHNPGQFCGECHDPHMPDMEGM